MQRFLTTLLASAVAALTVAQASAQSVNFNNLTPGSLNGQDGWLIEAGNQQVVLGSGIDVTNVVQGSSSSDALRSRGISPTAQNTAVWQFDANLWSGNSAAVFGPAAADGTTNVAFGLEVPGNGAFSGQNTFYIFLRSSDYNSQLHYVAAAMPAGTGSDWFRLRMNVDYAAYSGDGAASFYDEDLTLGDSSFAPVAGLQNINLGLTANNLVFTQPTDLNDYFIYQAGSELDNLSFTTVPLVATPEPGSVALLFGIGIAGLACTRRHK